METGRPDEPSPRAAAAEQPQTRRYDSLGKPVTIWDHVLEALRAGMPEEDFRRWFGATAYASDSGDQITVWVPSEGVRRHLDNHYQEAIARALAARGRPHCHVRLVVSGFDDDDENE